MNRPAQIPTAANAEAAWERYAALVCARTNDRALMVDLAHSIATARAWAEWRDLFLALDR